MRLLARCPTKTDLESALLDPTKHSQSVFMLHDACTQYSYNTSATTYLKSVCQQLQEITQLTKFAALIKLSTTNQAHCFPTAYLTAYKQHI